MITLNVLKLKIGVKMKIKDIKPDISIFIMIIGIVGAHNSDKRTILVRISSSMVCFIDIPCVEELAPRPHASTLVCASTHSTERQTSLAQHHLQVKLSQPAIQYVQPDSSYSSTH